MRVFSWILFGLSALVAALGVLLQIWVQGMRCAYVTSGTAGQNCRWTMPWTMGYEDILYLFVIPFGLALVLFMLGLAARRRAARP